MSEMPVNDGGPEAQPPEPPAAPVSGVRTEHQLRLQLKDAMVRVVRNVLGAQVRKLKAALWAAGFPDPNPKRRDEGEAQAPAPTDR